MLEIATTSVRDFMRALLVTEPHFAASSYYFRGQRDASWGLVPSACRVPSWTRYGGMEELGLVVAEDGLVANDTNLEVVIRQLEGTLRQVIKRMGLPVHLVGQDEALAFAQHVGLPTLALDWSRSPWTAAYFAAAGAANRQREVGSLAVFAMSTIYLSAREHEQHARKLDISSAGNPNLLAQQGVLVVLNQPNNRLLELESTKTLALGETLSFVEKHALSNHVLKITLPWALAPTLLRTLRDQELHAATMFPGIQGVAELVREVFIKPT